MENHSKKIMFIASSGGHLSEIFQLAEMMGQQHVLVTERIGDISTLEAKGNGIRVKTVKAGSRKQGLIRYGFLFLRNLVQSAYLFTVERPEVIISTGSHTFIPFLWTRQIFFWRKCEVIYIESIARVHSLSQTGKMCIRSVDAFYVQWEDLFDILKEQYPHVQYEGRLL